MYKFKYSIIGIIVVVALFSVTVMNKAESKTKKAQEEKMTEMNYDKTKYDAAIFAGGCFWCMTPPFEKLDGVQKVIAGYTGGQTVNPTYEEVCTGSTGHLESVFVIYDPKKI